MRTNRMQWIMAVVQNARQDFIVSRNGLRDFFVTVLRLYCGLSRLPSTGGWKSERAGKIRTLQTQCNATYGLALQPSVSTAGAIANHR